MTLPKLSSTSDHEPETGRRPGQPAVYGGATQYRSRAHKLATLVMMTSGSANAAMFPMMFISYGGVPFLLAYLVLLMTVAMPMMQLESNLAQFAGDGNCGIFSTVPLFLGTGYALTLYVILRVVADSLPLSDVLLQIAGVGGSSIPWPGSCPGGWTANNRTCYVIKHGSVPCRSLRSRFVDSFRRLSLGEGVPLLHGDQVALVPSKSYQQEAAGCMPDLYTPLPPYDFRRQQALVEHTFDNIRVQPLLSMAAIWVLVFTLAHVGFIRLKNFFYVMLGLHVATAVALLLRALSLEGAARGLQALAYADWSHVLSAEMWCQALYTCLESVGVTGTVYLAVQRLNAFKNNFHEDVRYVLVADIACKGIGTFTAFLNLGYLSARMGVDVRVLIDYESNIIVSITPQALSLAPDPEFWSQMYLLWLLSSLVPKLLIVPDIIIEAVSLPHPYVLRHRLVAHFIICSVMFIISIIGCSSGGASVVSMLAYSQDQSFRLLMVALEAVVILQFYGVRRLAIDENMMTSREPSNFVKICWSSVIPLVIGVVVCGKVAGTSWHGYPLWLLFIIICFGALELSSITVFALTLLECTKLKPRQSVAPLPVRVPTSWEDVMAYRQHIALEIVSSRKTDEGASATTSPAEAPPTTGQEASQKPKDATPTVPSDSEYMASDLYVASERTKRAAESPSDWRNFSLGDESGGNKKSKKKRSARKPVQETGTLHVSRNLSSVRRLARRDQQVPPKPTKAGPAAMVISKPRPLLQEAKRHHVLAPADKVVPDKGDYKFGDSFEDLDMVADSAALPAPASSAEAQNKKAVAQPAAVRPVENDHHNLPPLLWHQYLARGHKPAHLGVPPRPSRNVPVTTKPPATAPTAVAAAAATTSPVLVEASGAPRVEKWVAATDREAAHQDKGRQAASGHPNIANRASRKRSSSQRSSMSSRKTSFGSDAQSVATARRATKKASPSATSSKVPVSEAVPPAAATLGKSSQGKRCRLSKLSHTSNKQSGEERESPRLKSTSNHELDRRPSRPNGSAQPAPLASDVSSTKGPSGTGAETGKFEQATPVQPVVPGEMHLAAPPASGALKSPIQGTEEAPGHSGTEAPTSAVPAPREEESKDVPSSHVHQLDYGIATTANQPDTLDVNKPPTDKPARLLHNLAVGLKRRSRRRRLTRKSLDSNQDVDDMAALRATDISVVSGESCPLDHGSSASISLGSALGVVTSQTATIHAVQAVSGSSIPPKEASAGQPSAPAPAIVAPKSVSQTSAKTTSSGTQHSVSSKELERSTAAAAAGVEARDETRWENADPAGASSPKESRGTSGKGNVHPRHRSRRSPKKQRHTSSSDHSVEHHGSDSPR